MARLPRAPASLYAVLAAVVVSISNPQTSVRAQDAKFFQLPAGWTETTSPTGWVVQSQAYTEGVISFMMPLVSTLNGGFEQSFAAEVPVIVANSFGDITASSPVENIAKMIGPSPVLKSTHIVTIDETTSARVEVIGYPVSEGIQMMYVLSPAVVPANAGPMVTLHDWAEGIRLQNYALTPERLATALGDAPPSDPGSSGTATPDTASGDSTSNPKCRIELRGFDTSRYEQYNCVLYSGSFIPVCQSRYVPGREYRNVEVCD